MCSVRVCVCVCTSRTGVQLTRPALLPPSPHAAQALDEGPRRMLLRREIEKRLTDGKAKFNAKLLLEELPQVIVCVCVCM